jgi:hypothetical protein
MLLHGTTKALRLANRQIDEAVMAIDEAIG